jgi:gliding motility-associated-like protein
VKIKNWIFILIIILLNVNDAVAQLCQGSLGDPIVDITFGAGNNPGASLSAATTAYGYVLNDCPTDGFYTVRNNTSNCFSSSWHSLAIDHTGNTDGYFMLVNASIQPSAFYIDTVKGLCSNTTFEFAAWIVNVLKPFACDGSGIQPNLTFTIEKTDGTLLQTYNTGFIPGQSSPQWKQFGFFFTTPVGISDVVLRIFNNSQGGCGNDLALDDITFRPCGPLITTSVDGYTSDSIFYCEAAVRSFTLRAVASSGFSNPLYQWQQSTDGINWTDIAGANSIICTINFPAIITGQYKYRLAAAEQENFNSAQCRVVSKVITIIKGINPVTTVQITSPACEGGPVIFTATGGTKYNWYTGDGGLNVTENPFTIPVIDFSLSGKIYARVENAEGCFHTDSAMLQVLPKPTASVSFDNATICTGRNIQLGAGGGISYKWAPVNGLSQTDIADPIASPVSSTVFVVTVTGSNTCTDTASVKIEVSENIKADAGADKIIIKGETVQLINTTGQGIYSWSPNTYLDNATTKEPYASPVEDIDYVLTVTSVAGCNTDMDTVNVIVFNDIYVPNAFSPDGNGTNDTWNIPALAAFPNFELYVYNRIGGLVYQCKNNFIPWDGYYKGEPLESGAYVYFIKLNNGKKRILKGSLMLIR